MSVRPLRVYILLFITVFCFENRTREKWNEVLLQESTDEEKLELALKRDMIRRQEKPYEQESSDYCFHCKSKNRLRRCDNCHLALCNNFFFSSWRNGYLVIRC